MFQIQLSRPSLRRLVFDVASVGCLIGISSAQTLPVTTSSEAARHAFEAGRAKLSHAYLDEASALFDQAIKADPQFGLAQLYGAVVAPDGEREAFMRAASAAKVSPGEAKMIEAYAAHIADRHDHEIDLLVALRGEFPEDRHVAQYLGNELLNQGRHDEAIAVFETLKSEHPTFAGAYNMLGYAAMAKGDDALAEKAFKEYVRIAPAEANPDDSLGEFYMEKGQLVDAEACFQSALAIDPSFVTSANNLVRIAIQRKGDQFESCIAKRDAKGLAALYTKSGQLLPPNKLSVEGRDAIQAYWKQFMSEGNYTLDIQTLEVFPSERTATEVAEWTLSDGGRVVDSGRCMVVWGKVNGEWLCHRDTWSSERPLEASQQ